MSVGRLRNLVPADGSPMAGCGAVLPRGRDVAVLRGSRVGHNFRAWASDEVDQSETVSRTVMVVMVPRITG